MPRRLSSSPIIAFSVVDLPAPLRPISATTSPRPTSSATSNRICAAPYHAFSARASSSAAHAAACATRFSNVRPLPKYTSCTFGCVADLGRPALGDQPSARQHDRAVGVREHDVHAVLGEQHRGPALDDEPLRQRHQLVALARRHAGRRLVHQQQLRCVRHRDRELHALDVAVREHAGRPVGLRLHADLIEQVERVVASMVGSTTEERPDPLVGRQQRHLHVLDDRQRRERLGDLERAADAEPPDVARLQADELARRRAGSNRHRHAAGRRPC